MRRAAYWLPLAVILSLSCPTVTPAQTGSAIYLANGRLGVGFDGNWTDRPLTFDSRRLGLREFIELRFQGQVLDPGILDFGLSLRPSWLQTTQTPDIRTNGNLLGFNFDLGVLRAAPIGFTFNAGRSQGSNGDNMGAEGDFESSHLSARLDWRNRVMPAFFSYRRRFIDNVWRPVGRAAPIRNSQDVGTFWLSASSSKTNLLLERIDFKDRVTLRTFTQHRLNLDHALRWGKGSSLRSVARYLNRADGRSNQWFVWSQAANLNHTTKLHSTWRYGLRFDNQNGQTGRSITAGTSGTYSILRGLGIGANLFGIWNNFTTARTRTLGIGGHSSFSVPLPLRTRFGGGLSAGYQWRDQESTNDWILVTDEEHVVPNSERFALNRPNADPASVVITDRSGALTYLEETDYRLIELGDLLEVLTLPGGRMQVGDTALVDYRYQLEPVAPNLLNLGYNLSLALDGFSLYHTRTLSENRSSEPVNLELANLDSQRTGLRGVVWAWVGTLDVRGEHSEVTTFRTSYIADELRAAFNFPIKPGITGVVDANGLRSRTRDSGRTSLLSAGASLSWQAIRNLRLDGRLRVWDWEQELVDRQKYVGFGLDVDWRLFLMRVLFRYQYTYVDFESGVLENRNRVYLSLVRRF